jgi:hypothetical protein
MVSDEPSKSEEHLSMKDRLDCLKFLVSKAMPDSKVSPPDSPLPDTRAAQVSLSDIRSLSNEELMRALAQTADPALERVHDYLPQHSAPLSPGG